ncbi:Vacuolar assembly/sorting proteins VPS39/VAM6/VPS3 [Ceraceosorus bombacis]|uniref:Vacuolar assembly/sorting proteins VPS39/VAM6/VPS3 n=1 Tax=Ceraceosorus bombacis TaxID=401625 RepID=A0A0P1BRD8_9BASI|nr:Vacuolar assembly/sorting proteins VPS39/VAM6/VPS3 [Ceraceosorus bombacis]
MRFVSLGEEEEDEDEKTGPTIRYLQNLGPEHIDAILEASHWVLATSPDLGMEHIIITLGEGDPALHEKLALLLLRRITSSVRAASTDTQAGSDRQEGVQQLASFLQLSHQYRAEKILSRLPASEWDDDLLEIRALLLGRLGQHESALKIYVSRLQDHEKAEEYCRKVWNASAHAEWDSDSKEEVEVEAGEAKQKGKDVFLILLKLYLRASEVKGGSDASAATTSYGASKADVSLNHLAPALALISRQGARIDAKSALDLLPPLVPLQDILPFALKTLQTQSSVLANKKVLRSVMESRKLGLEEGLIRLRSRRVKVTEGRTCPRCLKRLGNSVIAVVNTNGAVLHYSCR